MRCNRPVLNILFFFGMLICIFAGCSRKEEQIEEEAYQYEQFYTYNQEIVENLSRHYSSNTSRKSIMNIGDSISKSRAFVWQMRWQREGLRDNPKEGYIYLEKELSSEDNKTSEWGRKIVDGALEKGNPEFATILFGTNDMIRGDSTEAYRENMAYIVDAVLKHGTVPLVLTVPPSTKKELSVTEQYNSCLRDIAREKKVPLFDVYELFLSKGNWEALLNDGVHPSVNEERTGGYNIMDDVIFEVYKRLEKDVMGRKTRIKVKRPVARKSPAKEKKLPVRTSGELIYQVKFERGNSEGWTGRLRQDIAHLNSRGALEIVGLRAKVSKGFVVGKHTYIDLAYYAQGCANIQIQFYNQTKKDNFHYIIRSPEQEKWTTVSLNLNTELQDNEFKGKKVDEGDRIGNIQVYGTKLTERPLLIIDDIVVYEGRAKAAQEDLENERAGRVAGYIDKMKQEFGIEEPEYALGVETPMKRISYLHPLLQFTGKISQTYYLKSARHEYEGFQIVIIPFGKDLKRIKIECSDLVNKEKLTKIDKRHLKFYIEGFVQTKASWPVPKQVLGWKPDPLLRKMLFDVGAKEEQPIWLTVYTPRNTPAGRYEGEILIKPENSHPVSIKLILDVWDFTLPLAGHLRTPTTLDMDYVRRFYGLDSVPPEMRRDYYDILLEHRIDPTSLYHSDVSPAIEELEYCIVEKGLRTITLGYLPPSVELTPAHPRLRSLGEVTAFLRERGWLDKAVLYVADEVGPKSYERLKNNISLIRQVCPDLKIMAGIAPCEELYGYIDVWDPIMVAEGEMGWNRFIPEVCRLRQKAGDEVMWYVAASPSYPYPNVQMDSPLVDARILFWMTWKYGVTGFEYYYINIWGKNVEGVDGKKWPEVDWDTYSFVSERNAYNGDGMLIYPGPERRPCSSVRLENIRDGIEDYECFWLLKEGLDRLIKTGAAERYQKVIEETRQILEIENDIVEDMREFTREPQPIIAARDRLSSQIEKIDRILLQEVR